MTTRSESSMYGLNIGDEVEFIGLPKTIRGITNPLIGKTGIVTNIQPNDIDVYIEGYTTNKHGIGFLPKNVVLKKSKEEIDLTFTKEELAIIVLCIRGYHAYSSYGDSQTQEANRCAASAVLEVMYDVLVSDKEVVQKYIDLENKIDEVVPPKSIPDDELRSSTAFSNRVKPHLSIVRS